MPKPEVWIEDGVDDREVPFIIAHEYLERRLMRDRGMEYDPAHEVASRVEFDLRKAAGATPLLTSGGRKLSRRDLPKVTADAVYDYVLKATSARSNRRVARPILSDGRQMNGGRDKMGARGVPCQCTTGLAFHRERGTIFISAGLPRCAMR